MTISSSTSVFMISILGVPLTYFVNSVQTFHGRVGLLVAGSLVLLFMIALTYFAVRKNQDVGSDKIIYVFILGCFSSVVDLIIGLENDGIIYGFMTHYLRDGEPYLKSAYGTMICYWDGVAHYAMYIMMLSAHAWKQSYYDVGLYWVGSIGHSMLVLIPGSIIGKYGVNWSFLLNIPYMIIPVYAGMKFLKTKFNQPKKSEVKSVLPIRERPIDMMFVLVLVLFICVALFRAMVALGSLTIDFQFYTRRFEPFIADPSQYGKVQMLVNAFYFVPFYIYVIHGLILPRQQYLPELSILFAGASAQGQFSYICSSIHRRTPYQLRVPDTLEGQAVFWTLNLLLLVVPQLLALRCNYDTTLFYSSRNKSQMAYEHRLAD